jgi:hypothetical protein
LSARLELLEEPEVERESADRGFGDVLHVAIEGEMRLVKSFTS